MSLMKGLIPLIIPRYAIGKVHSCLVDLSQTAYISQVIEHNERFYLLLFKDITEEELGLLYLELKIFLGE